MCIHNPINVFFSIALSDCVSILTTCANLESGWSSPPSKTNMLYDWPMDPSIQSLHCTLELPPLLWNDLGSPWKRWLHVGTTFWVRHLRCAADIWGAKCRAQICNVESSSMTHKDKIPGCSKAQFTGCLDPAVSIQSVHCILPSNLVQLPPPLPQVTQF